MPYLKLLASTVPETWIRFQNFKSRSHKPFLAPFDLILHFVCCCLSWSTCMPNLKFPASTVPEIWRGSHNFKSTSRDPFTIPFDVILNFFDSAACTESVCEIWREYLLWWPVYGYFTTLPIWPQNAFSCPFWGGFLEVCSRILWRPQKAHP